MIKCDENKPYIFISYAHKDSDKVYEIIRQLENDGYNVWYDDGIDPGTEWDENIAKHVMGCAYLIAFVSNAYINSENCKDELNYARDLDKDRLLVYIEEVDLPAGMAMRMNRIQAIWWYKYENIKDAYNKLFSTPGLEKTKINVGAEESINAQESITEASVSVPLASEPVTTVGQEPESAITASKEPELVTTATTQEPITTVTQAPESPVVESPVPVPVQNTIVQPTTKPVKKKKIPVWVWIVSGIVGIALIIGAIVIVTVGKEDDSSRDRKERNYKDKDDEDDEDKGKSDSNETEDKEYEGQSLEWYIEEAEKGDAKAMAYAATLYYERGEYEDAVKWFKNAEAEMELTDSKMLYCYGYLYMFGYVNGQEEYEKALECYKKGLQDTTLDDAGKGDLYNGIGVCYYWLKDVSKEREAYEKAYNYGNAYGALNLATLYYAGYGVEQDFSKALEYYNEAERRSESVFSEVDDMGNYARCYYIAKDYENAIKWFAKAESTGSGLTDGDHLCIYGTCLIDYYQDYTNAIGYYERAVEAGNAYAMYNLGWCYEEGNGVTTNLMKAKAYYQMSMSNGYEYAESALNRLQQKMEY